MKLMGKIIVAASVFASATALAAVQANAQSCTPKNSFKTVEEGVLTIAVTTYAPYSYLSPEGEAKGVDGDIANKIAEMECLKVKAVAVDTAAGIQYVLSGKADITTGDWYRTAERAKVMNLSWPLYNDQMGIYTKEGFEEVKDIEGKSVGTVQGYLWVADLKKLLGSNLKLYPNSVSMQQDLAAGRIAVGIDGYSTGVVAKKAGAMPDIEVKVAKSDDRVKATTEAGQGSFPYSKKNPELGAALDANIKALHEDGTIKSILTANGMEASAGDVGEPRLID